MKKTGLALAVTAAALFVTGCATQGPDGSCCPAPAPAACCPAPCAPCCNSCKGRCACGKRHRKCNACNVDDQGS